MLNYGGLFEATEAVENYGVAGFAPNFPSGPTLFNVGVYGSAPVNISEPGPHIGSHAGYFDGDLSYTGSLLALSDSTVKQGFAPIAAAGYMLSQLKPYSYYFDTLSLSGMANVSSKLQYGLLAQQVEKVAPNLVVNSVIPAKRDSAGNIISPAIPVKLLNYTGIIPLLIEGFNKQQSRLDTLTALADSLMSMIAACCDSGKANMKYGNPAGSGSIDLESLPSIRLDQNDPNPFGENTIIRWDIPEAFGTAVIYFFNASGQQINRYEIHTKGPGELQVFGSRLSAGFYTYTLAVNGRVIESKRMLKAGY